MKGGRNFWQFILRTVAWRSRPTTGPFCFFTTKKFNEILKSRCRLGRTNQYSDLGSLDGNNLPNPKPIRNTQSSKMNREVEDMDEDIREMTFERLSPLERRTPIEKLNQ